MSDHMSGDLREPGVPPAPPSAADGVVDALRRLCGSTARALSGSGAGVSVMTEAGVPAVAVASDDASQRLEQLQFELGEGPCVDAFASRRPVMVPDLADSSMGRWPMYASAVREQGVAAVFAFPLQIGAGRLGVLDVFRAYPGPLSTAETARGLTFADRAVAILLHSQERATASGVDELDESVEARAELFQAQGMVMVQLGVTLNEALTRIRAYAYAAERPLDEVARDIVARRLQLDGEQS